MNDVLMKVAKGCRVAEVTEEYAEVDGQMKLTKRKKTSRDIPPDLKAVQILLGTGTEHVSRLSDEELEREKERLLEALQTKVKKVVKPKKAGTGTKTKKEKGE